MAGTRRSSGACLGCRLQACGAISRISASLPRNAYCSRIIRIGRARRAASWRMPGRLEQTINGWRRRQIGWSNIFESCGKVDVSGPAVIAVREVEIAFAPRPWPFAQERKADIAAHFADLR